MACSGTTVAGPTGITSRLDLLTRRWWRAVGRRVDLAGEHAWLDAPMAGGSVVRDGWLADAAVKAGGEVREGFAGAGLVADFAQLDGPGFRADDLHADVRAFYEHTFGSLGWRHDISEAYGDLRGRAAAAGYALGQNDRWIAACCIGHELPLLTRNRKHSEPLRPPGLMLR